MTPRGIATIGLARDEAHNYYLDGRGPITSVTNVLKIVDKSGPLIGWAKRETAASAVRNLDALIAMRSEGGPDAAINWLKTIPDYQRDRAADRGSQVHAIAEAIVRGHPPAEIPEELGAYVAAYHGFLKEWEPRWIAVEQMVFSLKHNYAGTFDAFAEIAGERWLLDIKTSTGTYPETGLQLAAYAMGDFIGRPGDPQKYRVPRATRYGVIHVVPQGAELVPYEVDEYTFLAFVRARQLWDWLAGPAKSIVGRPLTREGIAA